MNNVFSLRRFGLLLRKQAIEKRKTYLAGLGAYMITILVIYIVSIKSTGSFGTWSQSSVYLMGLYLGGLVYAALMFTDYSRKETGVFNLLLPASHLEKILVYLCYGVVFFWIGITACFLLVDTACIYIFKPTDNHGVEAAKPYFSLLFSNDKGGVLTSHFIFLFGQVLFLVGSIYFKRYAIPKTALVALILLITISKMVTDIKVGDFGVMQYNVINMTARDSSSIAGDGDVYFTTRTYLAEFSPAMTILICIMGALIFAGFCHVLYLRLKEKQL